MNIRLLIACGMVFGFLGFLRPAWSAEPTGGPLQDFIVRTWSKANKLPDDSVTTLIQSTDGYLWVGTAGGLARFDGVKFTPIKLSTQSDAKAVYVSALFEDSTGRIWIGSQDHGLFCWDAGTVKQYHRSDGLLDETITSVTADLEGHLWVGTHKGLNRLDNEGFTKFTKQDGLPNNAVLSVHASHSGSVWITTPQGICQFSKGRIEPYHLPDSGDSEDPEFLGAYEDMHSNLWAFCATYIINCAKDKRINYFPGEKSASTRFWSVCEGNSGRLWIGMSGRGVFCFDGADFQPVTLNSGRWPNDVRAICEDHEGNLWLGISEGGLIQLRPQSFVLSKESKGLPAGAASCLVLDDQGRLNVAMESGGIYVNLGDHFEKLADEGKILGQNPAISLCAGNDGSFWLGTFGTGLCQIKDGRAALWTTANGLADDDVLAVCSDKSGTAWAGTESGTLHRLDKGTLKRLSKANGLPGSAITDLLTARDGHIWIGTGNGDLLNYDAPAGTMNSVKVPPQLRGKPIVAMYENTNHDLWIGSAGGGLGRLNANGFSSWNTQSSLPDDFVLGITDDSEGNLWLATSKGLCRIPGDSIAGTHDAEIKARAKLLFETQPGANRSPYSSGIRALRSPEDRLWFATGSGLIGIDTRSWQPERPAPQVHVEAVLLDGKPMSLPGRKSSTPLELKGGFNSLDIQFTALSFEAPEKVRFRHRLDRFGSDWTETSDRHVKYSQLPSGTYEFQVTACNAEGVWNDKGTTLSFIVPTPLWRTPLALAIYSLIAVGSVAGAVRVVSHRRLKQSLALLEQQQAMERERVRIAQDMHDEIGSKLTKISFLSEMAKTEVNGAGPVSEKIDSIAGTSRELLQALDEIVWAVNPRNDTLEQLCGYLSQYAREYFNNTSVECHVSLQPDLPRMAMSAEMRHNLFLAFEEALNNVLKHSGATKVEIEIQVKNGTLKIVVTDNGRGFATSKPRNGSERNGTTHEGNGLPNMEHRLAEVGGRFSIESSIGHGATVTLTTSLNGAKIPDK